MLIKRCLLSILWLILTNLAYAAEIQVAVDRNPVSINDSFRIIFTANENPDDDPDFRPLQEHFEILGEQAGSSVSLHNGQTTRIKQWILQVMAKQSGDLLIPPVAFGSDTSKPITIKVTDDPQQAQSNDEIFLQVEASPEQAYVQSQVLYTVKLFRRVQIAQASLNEPEIKDAVIEKLVEDNTYTTQINNVEYVVTERKYAIFPQQSGVFTIAPLTMVAQVLSSRGQPGFNGFFNRQTTETRRVTSKAITLNVLPVPQQAGKSNWLSAESLELKETWSDNSLQVKVGEPLTRTLTLTAKATTVGQLPELAGSAAIDGIKSYPDQPQLREDKNSDGLSAFRQEKIAYIPAAAGEYRLPAIHIDWFNTKTGKMESSQLPAVTIKALATADDGAALPAPVAQQPQAETASSAQAPAVSQTGDNAHFWQWLSAALACGWLLTIVGFMRKTAPAKTVDAGDSGLQRESMAVDKTLKLACANNDRQAAKQALLQWGKMQFNCSSLTTLATNCPEPLAKQILSLNSYLYSSQPQDWEGQALWQAFVDNKLRQAADKKAPVTDTALEPLYKL